MNFGEVFSRAWQIIWRNKVLWIFGLLAGLAATGDNGSGLRFDYSSDRTPWLNTFFNNAPGWAWLLLVMVGLVLLVVVILLGALGRAALMRGAWLADSGETNLTFRQLFDEGKNYFVRVLILQIVMVALGLSLIVALLIPTVFTFGLALLCLWPLFCLLVPLFIGLSVLSKLAIAAITGENLGVMDGLRRGWEVLRANLLQIAAVAFVLLLGGYVISSVFGIPAMVMLAPLAYGARTGAIVGAVLFLIYLPILLAVMGLLTSYVDTVWTVAFRRLTGRGETAVVQPNVTPDVPPSEL